MRLGYRIDVVLENGKRIKGPWTCATREIAEDYAAAIEESKRLMKRAREKHGFDYHGFIVHEITIVEVPDDPAPI